MGLFDGIENAELINRGRFFPDNFIGTLKIKRTLTHESMRSGLLFIVEFEVIDIMNPGSPDHEFSPVRLNERRTWLQKMTDRTTALPNIKRFCAAVAGYDMHQKDQIEQEVSPHLSSLLDYAVAHPDNNDLIDSLVYLETTGIQTKAGNPFTRHDWAPHKKAA